MAKKFCIKALSVGLSLALCASLVAPALAVTYDIANGSVYVESDDKGVYSYQGRKTDKGTSRDKDITVTGKTAKKSQWDLGNAITVGDNVEATITLKDVDIDASDAGKAALSISGAFSDVTVELDGENTLKSGDGHAGLELNGGASVTIQDKNGDGGSLAATGEMTGIGSKTWGTAGDITISGGTVTAKGYRSGVGIGGGESGGKVGNITISGGTVTATGGYGGAGIGSGEGGKVGNITISGGTVTATGGYQGAGIGTGYNGRVGDITISGGKVTATGGNNSAGIGAAQWGKAGDITISGGTVTVKGGYAFGAGIGCGCYGTTGDITISGGTVTATADYTGIGSGDNSGKVGDIIIGDDVTLLVLTKSGWAVNPRNKASTVAGSILISKLDQSAVSTSTVFTVLDKDGNEVRTFDVNWEGKTYTFFAIDLPDSETDYLIAQKDEDGRIVGYLVYDSDNKAVYRTEQHGDSVTPMQQQDGLVLKNANTKYVFVDKDGGTLPKEVTNLANSYAASYEDVKGEGGKWVFQNWTNTGIVDENGCLRDAVTFTGTWKWEPCDHTWDDGEQTKAPTCVDKGETTYTCEVCGKTEVRQDIEVDPDAHDMGGWHETKKPQPGVKGEEQRECQRPGCGHTETRELPALPPRGNGGGGTFIDDVAVPLAGLFTRADAIGYLWQQSGEPEAELSDFPDVPEDHQWAVAIGWAQDMGIALPDEEGNFRPDDLVLRSVESLEIDPEGELQEFLNRYAVYAGIVLEPDELFIELGGEWDDVIMGEDAQVIFDDFFAKLEAALAEQAA